MPPDPDPDPPEGPKAFRGSKNILAHLSSLATFQISPATFKVSENPESLQNFSFYENPESLQNFSFYDNVLRVTFSFFLITITVQDL